MPIFKQSMVRSEMIQIKNEFENSYSIQSPLNTFEFKGI